MSQSDINKAREIAQTLVSMAAAQGSVDKARTLQSAGMLYVAIHNAERTRL